MVRLVRVAASVVCVAVGGWFVYGAYETVSNLWASYRDSPVITYALLGALWLTVAAAFFAAAVAIQVWGVDPARWPRRLRRRRQTLE